MHDAWYSFALGHSALPALLWAQTQLDCTASRVVSSPSGKMGLEGTLLNTWGCDSAPCLSVGKSNPRAGKIPPLRNQIKQICTLLSPTKVSVPSAHPQLSSADEQNH